MFYPLRYLLEANGSHITTFCRPFLGEISKQKPLVAETDHGNFEVCMSGFFSLEGNHQILVHGSLNAGGGRSSHQFLQPSPYFRT